MEQYATINLPDYHMCGILYAALAWALGISISEWDEREFGTWPAEMCALR